MSSTENSKWKPDELDAVLSDLTQLKEQDRKAIKDTLAMIRSVVDDPRLIQAFVKLGISEVPLIKTNDVIELSLTKDGVNLPYSPNQPREFSLETLDPYEAENTVYSHMVATGGKDTRFLIFSGGEDFIFPDDKAFVTSTTEHVNFPDPLAVGTGSLLGAEDRDLKILGKLKPEQVRSTVASFLTQEAQGISSTPPQQPS